ncbi:hypothetical protein [Streptomyces sp. NPDC058613]|uniref:hypothetical protein n=1 Tax=unclassified Streptomyces TaxID=2593676 RepID=UPI0036560C80
MTTLARAEDGGPAVGAQHHHPGHQGQGHARDLVPGPLPVAASPVPASTLTPVRRCLPVNTIRLPLSVQSFPGQAPGAVPASRAACRWTSAEGATSGPAAGAAGRGR